MTYAPKSFLLICLAFICLSCSSIKAPKKNNQAIQTLWSKRVAPKYISGNLAYNRKSAAINEIGVFAAVGEKTFKAWSLNEGQELWSFDEQQRIVSTPALGKGIVLYGLENAELIARDQKTGKVFYKVTLTSAINSQPVIKDGRVFISLEEHGVVALELSSGELLWSYQRPLSREVTLARGAHPIIYKDTLITGFDDGAVVALQTQDGGIKWEYQLQRKGRFADLDLNPLYAHRKLYIGGLKKSVVLDIKSGLKLKTINQPMSSNPVSVGESIIFGKPDGIVEMISSTGTFQKRVRLSNKGIAYTGKLSSSQILAITHEGVVYILDATSLKPVKKFSLGHPESTVADDVGIYNGYAAIMTTRYRLYLIKSLAN